MAERQQMHGADEIDHTASVAPLGGGAHTRNDCEPLILRSVIVAAGWITGRPI
jgi:hypothetical protein